MLRLLPTALLAALLLGCGGETEEAAPAGSAVVASVTDGDTIRLADGRRVRLVQIDAPEPAEDECYGREATDALRELLPAGTRVELRSDPALDRVDRFGRTLAYVFLDGSNVNLSLVRRGAASAYFFGGERGAYASELLEAAEEAEHEDVGLWGACPAARLEPERALDTG